MKTILISSWLVLSMLIAVPATAAGPDSTGLPGDNLDLRATLELFKKSKSPEDFEKKLNSKDQHVNNLDLNGDGNVDYLRVYDIKKGDVHALVLQDPVSDKESQDVAVIEIEKRGDESAIIDIRGDENVYGDDIVVEPKEGKKDSTTNHFKNLREEQTFVFVNVWYWPCVQYIYYPDYVVWISPWYWAYYPMWWDPWMPYPYYTYYGWTYIYYDYYYYDAPIYVLNDAHNVYQPRRVVSSSVEQRYSGARTTYKQQKAEKPREVPQQSTTKPGERPKEQPRTEPQKQPTEQPRAKPRENVQPAPQPQPRPQPRPQPAPQPRPRVQPAPQPRPAPTPRPVPRPRYLLMEIVSRYFVP